MSIQYAAVLAYIRFARRRAFRSPEGLAKQLRADQSDIKDPPAPIRAQLDVGCVARPGYELWRLAPRRDASRSGVHVLYLHGGAFVFGITPAHWQFLARLVKRTGCTVHVALYPRAPRHHHQETQAAVMDAAAYTGALAGDRPFILMGDSAGASLALWAVSIAKQRGIRLPATTVLISPCADLALDHPEISVIEERDPWLTRSGLQRAFRLWLGETAPGSISVNPIAQDLSAMPPTHIFIGDRDILLPDCVELAQRLKEGGTTTQLHVGRGMCHVWPLLPVPEARESVSLICGVLRQHGNGFAAGAPPQSAVPPTWAASKPQMRSKPH